MIPALRSLLALGVVTVLASCATTEPANDEPDPERLAFFVLDTQIFNENVTLNDTLRVTTSLGLTKGGPMHIRHSASLVHYQVWCNSRNVYPGPDIIQQYETGGGYWTLKAGEAFGGVQRGGVFSHDVFELPTNLFKVPDGWAGPCFLTAYARFSICESSDEAVLSKPGYDACPAQVGIHHRSEFEIIVSN